MPFTLAHPIAAAPIWCCSKRKLDLPGLLIGAMIPDLEYFIALQPTENIGHTPWGIAVQGIPCSIALIILIRYLLKRPLLSLLPVHLAARFPRTNSDFWKLSHLLNLTLSIAIGAISHICWDGFTHTNGWFVNQNDLLLLKVATLPIYKWLQYSNGVLGFLALAVWLFYWLGQRTPYHGIPENPFPLWKWLALICIVLGAGVLAFIAADISMVGTDSYSAVVVRAVIGSISGVWVGLCVYSILYWLVVIIRQYTTSD